MKERLIVRTCRWKLLDFSLFYKTLGFGFSQSVSVTTTFSFTIILVWRIRRQFAVLYRIAFLVLESRSCRVRA
jgi:hypothetical protein